MYTLVCFSSILYLSTRCFVTMNSLPVDEGLYALEKKIDALTILIDQQNERAPKSINCSGGQESSSYNYKEQVQQLSNNERIYALLEEAIRECNLVF